MTKKPRVNKNQDQILHDMDMARKRTFIRESFYPALEKATVSVDEAGMLLQAMVSLIMEDALKTLKEKKISEIKDALLTTLTEDGERKQEITALLDSFGDMSLFETRGHLESMKAVIEQMKIDEFRGRSLGTLNPDWDRYLNQ